MKPFLIGARDLLTTLFAPADPTKVHARGPAESLCSNERVVEAFEILNAAMRKRATPQHHQRGY